MSEISTRKVVLHDLPHQWSCIAHPGDDGFLVHHFRQVIEEQLPKLPGIESLKEL